MRKLILNNNENFDGIIEKVIIDNDKKKTIITIKQWNTTETHSLSILEFNDVVFQSLPDISSFNLITEITNREHIKPVSRALNEYLSHNPTSISPNTIGHILKDINNLDNVQSYLFESGYCKDWLIICSHLDKKEQNDIKN